ncbi:hemin uptake protein HemP [Rhodopseudomonas sp. HC1]|uniref:hemin uptake protein HemP n=1 Tax=Rhodopseudomonas infernalis TaxID=2897386 RepID=UPI001EE82BE3|nr:hemin uptake protein HemP [Rhodopseudomonas infernalis]MCG6204626.1 hemin uptake protein HemP [Rhodopseudomonas infernalis]
MIERANTGSTAPAGAHTPSTTRAIRMIDNQVESSDLFSLGREIVIAHGDDKYRLRLTSQNKLILTK